MNKGQLRHANKMLNYQQHQASMASHNQMIAAKKDFSIKKTRNHAQGGSGHLFAQASNPGDMASFGYDHGKSMSNIIGQNYQQITGANMQVPVNNQSVQQLQGLNDANSSSMDIR